MASGNSGGDAGLAAAGLSIGPAVTAACAAGFAAATLWFQCRRRAAATAREPCAVAGVRQPCVVEVVHETPSPVRRRPGPHRMLEDVDEPDGLSEASSASHGGVRRFSSGTSAMSDPSDSGRILRKSSSWSSWADSPAVQVQPFSAFIGDEEDGLRLRETGARTGDGPVAARSRGGRRD
mmetsp:Transcript_28662/g.89112  ORF Transcript_28662/g.89112 Transcript_28662/m.89112 type:complete len:179 (-) Transcript_28662:5-541(-)